MDKQSVARSVEHNAPPPFLSFDVWQCCCGWIVSDKQYKSFAYDFGCPQCGTAFSYFHFRKAERTEAPQT